MRLFAQIPNALVASMLAGMRFAAGADLHSDWVWCVPFLIGGVVGLVGFLAAPEPR